MAAASDRCNRPGRYSARTVPPSFLSWSKGLTLFYSIRMDIQHTSSETCVLKIYPDTCLICFLVRLGSEEEVILG